MLGMILSYSQSARLVRFRRTQELHLTDDHILGRCLQGERQHNSLGIFPFVDDQGLTNFANWLEQPIIIMLTRMLKAIGRRMHLIVKLVFARCKLVTKEMQQRKVYLIGAMGVRRMNSRLHVGRIIVKNVENIVAIMLVGADDASIKRHMIGDQCVGDNSY